MTLELCITAPKLMCESLANELNIEKVDIEKKKFPDGEVYIRIPKSVTNENVIIVNTGYPSQNDRIIETLLAIDTLRDLGASRVTLLMPYVPYARQDRRFREGEPISIKTLLKSLSCLELDNLIVVNIHKTHSLQYFEGVSINVNVLPYLAKEAAKELTELVVLAPDKGALGDAQSIAKELKAEWDYLEKFRDRITGEVSIRPKELDVRDKNVLIVDDMISTGGTLALATKELKKRGAKNVIAVVAHALLVNDAVKKLKDVGLQKIVTANTLAKDYNEEILQLVDISSVLAKHIKELGLV